jgi:hypothetical protein
MESVSYKGWTIKAYRGNRGFGAVITDPHGKPYEQSAIGWPNHLSAQHYAQKFIDWYIKLENRLQEQETAV